MGTIDGAVWIGHMLAKNSEHPFKLPATKVLDQYLKDVEEFSVDSEDGFSEITYHEEGDVGYLAFDFYNGAMSVDQSKRLLVAYCKACSRPTKVIVLLGGDDFWSNGMHLNLIEAADSASDESWRNINAIDDLAEAIIRTDSHITVAALQGNAGAGGVFLARAADLVWLREGIILNPHYKDMGNLFGSEFWTYLLPRYAGAVDAEKITNARLPMGTREAVELALGDERFGNNRKAFLEEVKKRSRELAASLDFKTKLEEKNALRARDEIRQPLSQYRENELAKMRSNFYGFDPSYHVARYNFVYKIPKSRTPFTIARHRDRRIVREQRVSA